MLGDAGKDASRGGRPRTPRRFHSAVGAVKGLLRRRLAVWFIALFGALLVSPSLSSGLQTEDFGHSLLAQSSPWYANIFGGAEAAVGDAGPSSPEDLLKQRRREIYAAKDAGATPWITSPDWRVAFWRPLASWTHHFDYTVLSEHPWVMHAHSVAWYFVLLLVVGFLFRRTTSSLVVASVAALLYAIDESHGFAVGWLANRNALMATVFGVSALLVHDMWRGRMATIETGAAPPPRRWRWALPWISALLLYCALASGEFGVGAFAYILAHALTLDRARWRTRIVALVPAVAAGLVWAIPYRLAGYGAHGSGLYVDPIGHPGAFAHELLSRFPTVVSASLSGLPPELFSYVKASDPWFVVLEVGIVVLAALVLAPLLRDARIRFWAAGLLLSALPICTAAPGGRTLFFTTLGAFALLAELVGALARTPRAVFARRVWRVPAVVVAVLALVPNALFAVGLQPMTSLAFQGTQDSSLMASDDLFEAPAGPTEHLLIVNAPAYYWVNVLLGVRRSQGKTVPDHVRVLHAGFDSITVSRPTAATLSVHAPGGFVSTPVDEVYRARHVRFNEGELLPLSGVLIRVDSVDDEGMATKVTFRFGRTLTDDRYRFVSWTGTRFRPFTLPAVGERLAVPGVGDDQRAATGDEQAAPE